MLSKGNKVSDWLNKFNIPFNDLFSSSRSWLSGGKVSIQTWNFLCSSQQAAKSPSMHGVRRQTSSYTVPWEQVPASGCSFWNTECTWRNAAKIPVLTNEINYVIATRMHPWLWMSLLAHDPGYRYIQWYCPALLGIHIHMWRWAE